MENLTTTTHGTIMSGSSVEKTYSAYASISFNPDEVQFTILGQKAGLISITLEESWADGYAPEFDSSWRAPAFNLSLCTVLKNGKSGNKYYKQSLGMEHMLAHTDIPVELLKELQREFMAQVLAAA